MTSIYTKNPPIIILIGAVSLISLALFLIKKFSFNYRKKTIIIATIIAFLVLTFGILVSQTSFNQKQKGKWRWVYCQLNEQDCQSNKQNRLPSSCKRK